VWDRFSVVQGTAIGPSISVFSGFGADLTYTIETALWEFVPQRFGSSLALELQARKVEEGCVKRSAMAD
jgi:hypothetical protein